MAALTNQRRDSEFSRQLSRELGNARETLQWLGAEREAENRSKINNRPMDPNNEPQGWRPVTMDPPPPPPDDWLAVKDHIPPPPPPPPLPSLTSPRPSFCADSPRPYQAPRKPEMERKPEPDSKFKPLAEILTASLNGGQKPEQQKLAAPGSKFLAQVRRASEQYSHPIVLEKEAEMESPRLVRARPSFADEGEKPGYDDGRSIDNRSTGNQDSEYPSRKMYGTTTSMVKSILKNESLPAPPKSALQPRPPFGETKIEDKPGFPTKNFGIKTNSETSFGSRSPTVSPPNSLKSTQQYYSPGPQSRSSPKPGISPGYQTRGARPVSPRAPGGVQPHGYYSDSFRELNQTLESVVLAGPEVWPSERVLEQRAKGDSQDQDDRRRDQFAKYAQALLKLCKSEGNPEKLRNDVRTVAMALQENLENTCCACFQPITKARPGCSALDKTFHIECFVCDVCHTRLAGGSFYSVDGKPYCDKDYKDTLDRCEVCHKPILDRILRASGKPFHPACFTCTNCKKSLDGIPFTVDTNNAIHCVDCFHDKYAPRCARCSKAIVPEDGKEESLRVVAMDKSYHVDCYRCEDCNKSLNSKIDGHGCYPLDDHILCKDCNIARVTAKQ